MSSNCQAMPDEPRTCIESLDPRARLAATALLSIIVAVAQTFSAALLGLLLGCALLAAARPPLRQILRRAKAVNLFLLFLWCITPWTTAGKIIWSIGPLAVTDAGLSLSLLVTLKANAICALFTALADNMEISATGHALRHLGCPQQLVLIIIFMGRYTRLLHSQWQSLMTAARLRCFELKSNAHAWSTLGALLGLLLVKSHERAHRVHEAMLLRGFTGSFHPLDNFCWRKRDTAFCLVLLLCAVLLIWVEFTRGAHA